MVGRPEFGDAPATVGILPAGEEGQGARCDAGRERSLGGEALHSERGGLIVSTLEGKRVLGADADGLIREGPTAAGTLLIGQPADRCCVGGLPSGFEPR